MILGYLTIAVTITAILWRLTHPRHVRVERYTDAKRSPLLPPDGYCYDEEYCTNQAFTTMRAERDAADYAETFDQATPGERSVLLATGQGWPKSKESIGVYGRDK